MKPQTFIPVGKPDITAADMTAVLEVMRSGHLTTGPVVTRFEEAIGEYLSNGERVYCCALNSCTAALHLALLALGIGPGDEVLTPTWTFAASAMVSEWLGATPVLCDIDPRTLNIDPEDAERRITSRTKCIMPVHIGGHPCDMEAIADLAVRHGLEVVEDAAHAMGAQYKGKRVGTHSRAVCFSFYATKNLTTGEGGAVVSRDPHLIEHVRRLGYFGIDKAAYKNVPQAGPWAYSIVELGYKNNMDSMHAALGLSQLSRLEEMNARRRTIAARYRRELPKALTAPLPSPDILHNYHLFWLALPKGIDRNSFIAHLQQQGVGTSVHYVPLHRHAYYRKRFPAQAFPQAEAMADRVFSLPIFPGLSDDDIRYVIEIVSLAAEKFGVC